MNHLQRYWPLIVGIYTAGVVASITQYDILTWEWWSMIAPMAWTIGALSAYRERVLKVLEKW